IQDLAVEKNRLELALAQKEAKRLERLVVKGSASQEDLDKKASEVAQRAVQVKSAEADLKRLKTAFASNRAKAQASLAFARANLTYYQANIDLESLAKNLDLSRSRTINAMVRAPSDGQVLKIRPRPGEVMRKEGLLTMGNLATMAVIAEV